MKQPANRAREPIPAETERIASQVVNAAYAVHKQLGPGLLESIYKVCLAHELEKRGLTVQRQVVVPIVYDGLQIEHALKLDLLVGGSPVVELKALGALLRVHFSQLLTHLKLNRNRLGLPINSNVPLIKGGIHRVLY